MIYQLTVETLRHGQVQAFLAAAAAQKKEAPAGRWLSEFGTLNQVYTLRRIETEAASLGDIGRLAYGEGQADAVLRREVRLLSAVKEFQASDLPVVELREYTMATGQLPRFLELMTAALPVRERFSNALGVWAPLSGEPDRVIHMWPYRDFAHRAQVRNDVAQEPAWQKYLATIPPLLREMSSVILRAV
ncbi:MAG: NIPSNAP family protein [Burkholderiaceae bacterium]|nr:NIPSNAP family protein [Burkholderiaceae bacterium]MDO9089169.1 NIPSNAP family protein [Burkholderiaceae bacterium]